jgi:hypothetical protein
VRRLQDLRSGPRAGRNISVVVRCDPATGTRVLVHRWPRPGRSPRSFSVCAGPGLSRLQVADGYGFQRPLP